MSDEEATKPPEHQATRPPPLPRRSAPTRSLGPFIGVVALVMAFSFFHVSQVHLRQAKVDEVVRQNDHLQFSIDRLTADNERIRQENLLISLQLDACRLGHQLVPTRLTPPTTGPQITEPQPPLVSDPNPSLRIKILFEIVPGRGAGPETWGDIAGRVEGLSKPEQHKIVLYTYTDHWYVQPQVAQPMTDIQPNGHWRNWTHLGDRYTALVVRPSFVPPSTVDALPATGGEVLAVASVQAKQAK